MFYKSFLITIILLFIVYLSVITSAKNTINKINIESEYKSHTAINFIKEINKIIPKEFNELEKQYILNNAIKIKKEISVSIQYAYEDVKNRIPIFIDKHYTVTGEYAELYSILVGNIGENLKKILYKDTNFNKKIEKSVTAIMELNMFNLNKQIEDLNEKVLDKINNPQYKKNIATYNNIIELIKKDTLKRYKEDSLEVVRLGGTITSASMLLISKTIAKKLTLKIMTKSSTKALIKYGTSGLGAVGGATAGSIVPGWGTAIGGAVGGLVGWFGTDKIIIEIDEYLNRDEFEIELLNLINKQQKEFENKIYKGIIKVIKKDITNKSNRYKNISIKDILIR
jgi:hypothetical protein